MTSITTTIPDDMKIATRNDLKILRAGDEISISFRNSNFGIVKGIITKVPESIESIKDMEGEFIVQAYGIGLVFIYKRIYGNNIASLNARFGCNENLSVNIIIDKTKSDIMRAYAKSKKMKIVDIKLADSQPEKLIGLPAASSIEPISEITHPKDKIFQADTGDVRKFLGAGMRSITVYNHVILDACGNFMSIPKQAPEVPMEDLTKKIVACHQMSGSLEWLKSYIEDVEKGIAPPVNEYHKNNT